MGSSQAARLQRGALVEFDFAVLNGHSLLLEACQTRLEQEGIKLDAQGAARSMGGRSFSSGLNALGSRKQKTLDVPTVMGVESIEVDQFKVRVVARTLPGKQFDVSRALRVKIVQSLARSGVKVAARSPESIGATKETR